ncbi:MAG: haloacid dehalogenase type II [Alphaproteobacteria bacterium]|nr:haloacid dehalogenase type II [Alphaproteobacteria bacterium]
MADIDGIKACVFDAYGTLFDFNAAAAHCRDDLGEHVDRLSQIWRTKQLQYTWLRSLMGDYVNFWQVTGDGLDYAFAELGLDDPGLRAKLMQLYMNLDAYPEVKPMLERLKAGGMKTAILSNGTPEMLDSAVANAGIGDLLDDILSVEDVGIYKPHPSVYQLAVDRLDVKPKEVCFQSSNSWDAVAAAFFGFRVVWINRFGQAREVLSAQPDREVRTLADLPPLLGL